MAPDWAQALEPVAPTIAAMGDFLRAELAAGRHYLPAGNQVLRAFSRPLADVRVLIVGQDPYPTPGHPVGLSFSVAGELDTIVTVRLDEGRVSEIYCVRNPHKLGRLTTEVPLGR